MEKSQTLTKNVDVENIVVTKERSSWDKYLFSALVLIILSAFAFAVGHILYTNPLVAFVYYAEHLSVTLEGTKGYFLTPFVLYGVSFVFAVVVGFIAGYMPQQSIKMHTNFIKSIPRFLKVSLVIFCIVSAISYVAPQRKTAYIMAGAYLANRAINSEAAQQVVVIIKQQLHNMIMKESEGSNLAPDTVKYINETLQENKLHEEDVAKTVKDAKDTINISSDTISSAASEVANSASKVSEAAKDVNSALDSIKK